MADGKDWLFNDIGLLLAPGFCKALDNKSLIEESEKDKSVL